MTRRTTVLTATVLILLVAGVFALGSRAEPLPTIDWAAILGDSSTAPDGPEAPPTPPSEVAAPALSRGDAHEASGAPAPADNRLAHRTRRSEVVGVSTHSLEEEHLDALQRMGVVNLRRTLRWKLFEEDRAYAAHWDDRLRAAITRGFRILVVLDEWPADASEARLVSFLGRRVADHPPVEAWQIGNEAAFPNLSGGEAWARIHNSAADAVKARSPAAKVITMGFSPEQTRESFARQFLATARRDAVAVHVYRFPASDAVRQLSRLTVESPIWVTEFGLDRNMVPASLRGGWEDLQRLQWQTLIEGALRLEIQRVYGYSLYTDEIGQYGPVESHGLLRPDGSWRPAATWLQGYLAGP